MKFEKPISVTETNIPGLMVIDLTVHGDSRGWFKENWQRQKLISLGLPDIKVVQNNISFNSNKGTTRGIHAEPWDKYISIASGSIFGAWVDLREGENFGQVFTCELDPSKAIFVPRGVGNSFQALEDNTAYTYLVNDHWSEENKGKYTFVNLADPELDIKWPIPLSGAQLSEADKNHPMLEDVVAMPPKRTLVIGANGQLGKALNALFKNNGNSNVDYIDIDTFNLSDPGDYEKVDWGSYQLVINAGAFTAVDIAEENTGRVTAWKANATGPSLLARKSVDYDFILVHISTDYVFDGSSPVHGVDEPLSPLSVYGQSKAAGDLAVSVAPKHYIIRTSWVIGDGNNFVKTMAKLSDRCADPNDDLNIVSVVNDQFGRLTFTDDLAKFIVSLVRNEMPFGTYNFSNTGDVSTWFDIAKIVFNIRNANSDCLVPVSSQEYNSSSERLVAERPCNSALELDSVSIENLGTKDWISKVKEYLSDLNE